jgi:hypothetical protein
LTGHKRSRIMGTVLEENFMDDTEQATPPTSRLARAAVWCLTTSAAAILGTIALAFVSAIEEPSDWVAAATITLILASSIAALMLGLFARIVVARSNGVLTYPADMVIVGASVILFFVSVVILLGQAVAIPERLMCKMHLHLIGRAMPAYAKDHNDELPAADKWCDLLVMKTDVSPAELRCRATGAEKGECSYAMNRAVAGKKLSELKPDMVVLFEVLPDEDMSMVPLKSRGFAQDQGAKVPWNYPKEVRKSMWNQVCGPERLDVISHKGGCNVLFGNMEAEFIDIETLPKLRWSLDDGFVFPAIRPRPEPWLSAGAKKVIVGVIAALAVMATGFFVWRYRGRSERLSHLTIGIIGAVCGVLMGFLAQGLHYMPPHTGSVGAIAGALTGLLAGLAYASLVTATIDRIEKSTDRTRYAAAVGMVTGVICSLVVHSVLLLMSNDMKDGMPLVAGIPFGVLAGGVVGWVAWKLMEESVERE